MGPWHHRHLHGVPPGNEGACGSSTAVPPMACVVSDVRVKVAPATHSYAACHAPDCGLWSARMVVRGNRTPVLQAEQCSSMHRSQDSSSKQQAASSTQKAASSKQPQARRRQQVKSLRGKQHVASSMWPAARIKQRSASCHPSANEF